MFDSARRGIQIYVPAWREICIYFGVVSIPLGAVGVDLTLLCRLESIQQIFLKSAVANQPGDIPSSYK